MKRNHILTMASMALVALALFTISACKSGGMAMTSRGQLLKINIQHPNDLPEGSEDNLDVVISNRGVNNIKDVLVDVELQMRVELAREVVVARARAEQAPEAPQCRAKASHEAHRTCSSKSVSRSNEASAEVRPG